MRNFLPMLSKNRPTFTFKHSAVFQGLLSDPQRRLLMSSSFTIIPRQRFQILFCPLHMVLNAPPQYQPQTTNSFPPPPPAKRKKDLTVKFPREMVMFPFEVMYQTRETVFHRDIQTPRRELKIRRAAEFFFDKI